jgi:D-alanine-D-alanine ligase
MNKQPKIVAITNENPAWPELDKGYAAETWDILLAGFREQNYTYRSFKFFDELNFLDQFDPREWLVWNGGEEWAGQVWSDATVAAEIERRGFAYTGPAPEPLRQAQDRMRLKQCLLAAGLPTLPARVFQHSADAETWAVYPAIVKGANQHASVGLDRESVVDSPEQLARRVEYLRGNYQDDALVEPFLDTREFQVAVLGNKAPEPLPPSEIVFSMFADARDRLHTQQWKIDRESRGYKEIQMPCPAPLDRPDWRVRLEEIAVQAYLATGMRDYARFDFRMLGDEPQILDVNANPELDPLSVVVTGARARGMTFGQMAGRIIDMAAARMPR